MPWRCDSPKLCAMTIKRVVIGFVVFVGIVVAIFTVAAVSALQSLPSGELPADFDYHAEGITDARAAKFSELEQQLDDVAARFGADYVGGSGWVDRCEEGQANFTRQDAHAYVCRIEIVRVLPVQELFLANAARLGEALQAGQCPDGTDTDRTLAEPFSDLQDLNSSRGDCMPGYYDPAPQINGWLPAKPTADQLERARFDLPLTCYPWYEPDLCREKPLNLGRAIAAAPDGTDFLAIVTVGGTDEYHTEPWD